MLLQVLLTALLVAAPDGPSTSDAPLVLGLADRAAALPSGAGFALAGETGFALRSSDDRFRLQFRELLEFDGRNYFGPHPPERDRSSLAVDFAGFQVDGSFFGRVGSRIFTNFAQNRLTLLEAYLDVTVVPGLVVRAGKYPAPISEERLTPAPALPFVSTTLASFLLPSRETGLAVFGKLWGGRVAYNLSLSDGSVAGTNLDADVDSGKTVIARLFVRPFLGAGAGPLEQAGAGLGASTGDADGTKDAPLLPALRTYGGATYLAFAAARPDGTAVVATGAVQRLVPHAVWSWGPVAAYADGVWSRQRVGSSRVLLRGWSVVANVALTGERAAPLSFVVPAHPVDRGGWGTLVLVGGAGQTDAPGALAAAGLVGAGAMRRATVWAGGLNWYPVSGLAAIASYGHMTFTSFVGPDRPPEDTLTVRLQLVL